MIGLSRSAFNAKSDCRFFVNFYRPRGDLLTLAIAQCNPNQPTADLLSDGTHGDPDAWRRSYHRIHDDLQRRVWWWSIHSESNENLQRIATFVLSSKIYSVTNFHHSQRPPTTNVFGRNSTNQPPDIFTPHWFLWKNFSTIGNKPAW